MDPHIYPDPPLNPLNVLPSTDSPPFAIEQLTSMVAGNKTMFIRVAMADPTCAPLVGPLAPTISLQADTGDLVPLTGFTQAIYRQPGTNPADYVADASIEPDPSFNNVYLITIVFFLVDGNYAWQLRIRNNEPVAARDFTWVVSGTAANTIQPWIDVVPATLAYSVLVNGSVGLSTQIRNKGTGPLTVSSVTPALPVGSGLVLGALPSNIAPGGQQPLTVTFNAPGTPPAPNGVFTAVATIASGTGDDALAGIAAGHNHQLTLTATTQALEVVLLLDDSGSMSWDALGNWLPAGAPNSRWSELVSAVNPFLDLLAFFGEDRGRYGIARFPAGDPLNPATFDIVPATAIPGIAGMAGAQAAVAAITPIDNTPMGDGIDRVFAPATSYFRTDALSVSANRRWLLLMSDGAHNWGTHHPLEYILPPVGTAAAGASLLDQKIHLFAIGYGVTGHTNVDPALLAQLAAGSLGGGDIRRPDDDGVTAVQVASAFRDALKAGITPASSPGDPRGVFHANQGEARHTATITQYDGKSAFVLHWNTPDAKRLRLELLTPNCELITPENAGVGDFKTITFRDGDRFQVYMVDEAFVQNHAEPDRPRYGTWTLVITSPALHHTHAQAEQEIYEYDIIVDSNLRMELSLDRASYYAGDPIGITARLTADGKPVTGAVVALSTTAPGQAVNNWLARLDVPDGALAKAREFLHGKDSTPLLVKALGAKYADLHFDARKQRTAWTLTDPAGIGVYQAQLTNTATPEMYTFYITATGMTEDGITFRREGKLATNVLVQPEPAFTLIDTHYLEPGLVDVHVTPRDRFGNVLLVDPATAGGFDLAARGGDFDGVLTSQLNGTYSRQLRFDPGGTPRLDLLFAGKAMKRQTLPPIGKLHWADRILRFLPGAEAAKGANQHVDPERVSGDLFQKPQDAFVSLGAGGVLIVTVNDALMLPVGNQDVTVCVARDEEPRPYRVEAYVPDLPLPEFGLPQPSRGGWVLLGESAGGTQSFSLRQQRVKIAATALRITDLSRRTRGKDFRPLATPGVSIRGVGVLRVSTDMRLGREWLQRFYANPDA